ncbi:MAG TPA: glutamate synthase-related protein [Bacillota bacterium]|mgnify:CR=1 FL=1|nr:FMN-binding glutamate synthase family protein [Fastidiosipila sp.]HPX92783.1 glutamate synthase-related protein [Bacillota bacterium]HQB81660.1 glutamate synthase-related protein [Bacillota bacterium]
MKYVCGVCGYIFDEEAEGKKFEELTRCPNCHSPASVFKPLKEEGEEASKEDSDSGRVYQCGVCGYIFDEKAEGKKFEELTHCPRCHSPASVFKRIDGGEVAEEDPASSKSGSRENSHDLDYDSETMRTDPEEHYMDDIHEMAKEGKTIIGSMGPRAVRPSWDDIFILGAQLDPMPLDEHAPVDITTVIGRRAAKPMVLDMPVYISHMSFGALSKEAKISLAKGAAMAKTAMCSGEGGILPEEMEAAYKYIFEYVPNQYSVTDENLRKADAIEIKIGQAAKPGMGGQLPGHKVTSEIAAIRNRPVGEDILSPSRFPGIESQDDLKKLVDSLRERSGGRPIGIKLAAGRIEKDLAFAVGAGIDFVTIDGRGGATGASPKLLRDATGLPTIYALRRARKFLDSIGSDIELVITGGLRVSSDFAKAIALGADAVAIASAALMAAACQQYKICHTGYCPTGVTSQDPELRKRLHVDVAGQRVYNFLKVSAEELKIYGRVTGHDKIHQLTLEDLCTVDRDLAEYADIPHA